MSSRPASIPKAKRLTGARAKGLAYEKKVRTWLDGLWPGAVIHEQWFAGEDVNGQFFCQTDHILVLDHVAVVFETKLTQTFDAIKQINGLYRPVVALAFGRPVLGVQVCRNLVKDPGEGLIRNPRVIPSFGASSRVWTLHKTF